MQEQREPVEVSGELTQEERNWGMICHLSALSGFLFPFGNLIAPLIIWYIKRDESPYIDFHGKEALNFQITMALALFVSGVLILVLVGFLLLPVVAIYGLIMTIIAGVHASSGEHYRYPVSIRLIA